MIAILANVTAFAYSTLYFDFFFSPETESFTPADYIASHDTALSLSLSVSLKFVSTSSSQIAKRVVSFRMLDRELSAWERGFIGPCAGRTRIGKRSNEGRGGRKKREGENVSSCASTTSRARLYRVSQFFSDPTLTTRQNLVREHRGKDRA